MELIKPGTKIDFVQWAPWAIGFSWLLIAIGAVSLLAHGGPNYGVDFSGGTVVQVRFAQKPAIGDIRAVQAVWLGPVEAIDDPRQSVEVFERALPVMQLEDAGSITPGEPNLEGARCSLDSLELAVGIARSFIDQLPAVFHQKLQRAGLRGVRMQGP